MAHDLPPAQTSKPLFECLPADWQSELREFRGQIAEIDRALRNAPYLPEKERIFAALSLPLDQVKVVIFGQDPYPTPGHAMGLAFSVPKTVSALPPTLRNIITEVESDIGIAQPPHGDLSGWVDQGVCLLNRTLTVSPYLSLSHKGIGWSEVTNHIAKVMGDRGVVGVLWGKHAQELRHHFPESNRIESAHPSPLSAYRGFLGSRPFSAINRRLREQGKKEIDWVDR